MSAISDPSLRAAPRRPAPELDEHVRAVPAVHPAALPPAPRSVRARVAAFSVLAVVTVALGLRGLAALAAAPLDPVTGGAEPTWMIEVSTTTAAPTTAVLYGRDVGIQLVRVPAGRGNGAEARLVPARLAKGEVHLVSLGLTPLHVHASAPQGAQPMTFDATSPIITAFQQPRAIGVRVGW